MGWRRHNLATLDQGWGGLHQGSPRHYRITHPSRSLRMEPKPPTPQPGWESYPNLLRRPHSPNKGRGRLQVQIRRAFVGREVLTSSEVYDHAYAKRRVAGQQIDRPYRWSVVRILRTIADPIGRAQTAGRPRLWRLKQENTS
jgi:hypothetical protein